MTSSPEMLPEIAEMGFDLIWTAFEGQESNFSKLKGTSLSELYSSLRSRGVAILSSMIIGFPYQNREKIIDESRIFIELSPDLWQILIYFAFPGTPLYKKVVEQNLFLPEYQSDPDYRTFDGFNMHFKHPHLSAYEVKHIQRELYRKNFEILGPSLIRIIQVKFEGYLNLKYSKNPFLRDRAKRMKEYVQKRIPALYPAVYLGPNKERKKDAKLLLEKIICEFGELSKKEYFFFLATIPLSFWTSFTNKLNILQQPKLLRVEYNGTFQQS